MIDVGGTQYHHQTAKQHTRDARRGKSAAATRKPGRVYTPHLVLVNLAPGLLRQEPVRQQRIAPESYHVRAKDSMHLSDCRSRNKKRRQTERGDDRGRTAWGDEDRAATVTLNTVFGGRIRTGSMVRSNLAYTSHQSLRGVTLEARGGEGRSEVQEQEHEQDTKTTVPRAVFN